MYKLCRKLFALTSSRKTSCWQRWNALSPDQCWINLFNGTIGEVRREQRQFLCILNHTNWCGCICPAWQSAAKTLIVYLLELLNNWNFETCFPCSALSLSGPQKAKFIFWTFSSASVTQKGNKAHETFFHCFLAVGRPKHTRTRIFRIGRTTFPSSGPLMRRWQFCQPVMKTPKTALSFRLFSQQLAMDALTAYFHLIYLCFLFSFWAEKVCLLSWTQIAFWHVL